MDPEDAFKTSHADALSPALERFGVARTSPYAKDWADARHSVRLGQGLTIALKWRGVLESPCLADIERAVELLEVVAATVDYVPFFRDEPWTLPWTLTRVALGASWSSLGVTVVDGRAAQLRGRRIPVASAETIETIQGLIDRVKVVLDGWAAKAAAQPVPDPHAPDPDAWYGDMGD